MIRFAVSVIVPAYNPRPDILSETLAHLQAQTFPVTRWELLLIDNRSDPPLHEIVNLDWHPSGRIIREERPGLTAARLRGFHESRGALIILADDDNLLAPNYLSNAVEFARDQKTVGAFGGKSLPRYEAPRPSWFPPMGINLACRDLGGETQIETWERGAPHYPKCAPIGAGMVLRRKVAQQYTRAISHDRRRRALDRRGGSLVSGGDNDIVLTALANGWGIAYVPQLSLIHIIPEFRLNIDYQERLARAAFKSWVQVLALHGIQPWTPVAPWTVRLRQLSYYAQHQPWRGGMARIRYAQACGQAEGRASIR